MSFSRSVMKTLVFFICSLHLSSSGSLKMGSKKKICRMKHIIVLLEVLFFLTMSVPQPFADTHSLQYLYITVTPGLNLPECSAVGLVDGEQIVYYDSKIRKMIPKTEWIQKISDDDLLYWTREAEHAQSEQEDLHHLLQTVMKSFNHTKGVHTLQRMFSCEPSGGDDGDDENSCTRGYYRYGYDGEDFISLDLKSGTWTADKPQAEIFKMMWESTGYKGQYWKNYLENKCIEWLKKFMSYGRETLERKDPPTSSVFQKHSPSPEVVCHATGFFPKEVNITWRKDGEDVKEDVELRETLPNQDGSFQKRIILKVPAEDLQKHKYTCVIQHSSLKKEMVLEVPKGGGLMTIIVGVLVTLVVLVVLVVAGILVWKKKNSGFRPAPSSEGDSSSDKS